MKTSAADHAAIIARLTVKLAAARAADDLFTVGNISALIAGERNAMKRAAKLGR